MAFRKDSQRGQFDLFAPYLSDLPLRDQREMMERPFFSLSKRKRLQPIDYESPDGSIFVSVNAVPRYGMATIWDADILIWAASIVTEMREKGVNDIPRTLKFHPHELLKTIRRGTSGRHYEELRNGMARLQSTTIRTNIRATGHKKVRQFSWVESWSEITDEETGFSKGMTLTLSDWLYEGILMEGGVLAIHPDYFCLTGGRERWLYRVARKHAGGGDGTGFAITLPTLFQKSGAEGAYRRFKFEIRKIAHADTLPEFHLELLEQTQGEEPSLMMVRRSQLAIDHPAYEFPRRRDRRYARAVPETTNLSGHEGDKGPAVP
ncbi:MAG: replication initiator protein A [Acetobacteraceae bacterium]